MIDANKPRGQLLIQTLAMPRDTNANGDIFGGWMVSQMDLAAGIFAKKHCNGRAATVAINQLQFILPVRVGDLLSCYVHLTKQGNSSMTLWVETWKETFATHERHRVAEGSFVFVAIDESGQPRTIVDHHDH
ncbi:MAG: acyl-CoA thioesterase [Legionella sp. 21-45-4]|nr:MAG: acyl-CoA thioesterase [Legionella sp. 21-45-4]